MTHDPENWRGHDSAEAAKQRTTARAAAGADAPGGSTAPRTEYVPPLCSQPGCPKKTLGGAVPQYCKHRMCKECCQVVQHAGRGACLRAHKVVAQPPAAGGLAAAAAAAAAPGAAPAPPQQQQPEGPRGPAPA